MKTNYRRNFIDSGSFRNRSCETWVDKTNGISARIGNDFTNGHRGHARAVHGAKQHIRHAIRRINKLVTINELNEYKLNKTN